jgi:kynurenine formamidase
MPLPPLQLMVSPEPWLDLSHPLDEHMPNAAIFPKPRFQRLKSMPRDPMNVTEMQMVVHAGTHVDAPCHFFEDAPAFDAIPLERLMGPGVVLDIEGSPSLAITAEMLAAHGDLIEAGDIVALYTGWSRHVGTELYARHPYLTADAAEWLVQRRIKLLACDTPSADLPIPDRKPGFNWPAHHVLLSHGVLIAEHLTDTRRSQGDAPSSCSTHSTSNSRTVRLRECSRAEPRNDNDCDNDTAKRRSHERSARSRHTPDRRCDDGVACDALPRGEVTVLPTSTGRQRRPSGAERDRLSNSEDPLK